MCIPDKNPATGKLQIARDAVLDARGEVASTPAPCESSALDRARFKSGTILSEREEEAGAQCGAARPVACGKCRELERQRDIAIAEKDTAEARVKDLEIRLKDAIAAGDSVL